MLKITNTSITRDHVFEEFRRCKDTRLKERLHAILLCFDGGSAPQIAAIFYRNVETVRTWIKKFNEKGFLGLHSTPIPGRPSKMDEAQRETFKKNVSESPRRLGYHFSTWTAKLARFHLMRHFGVKYSLERVRQLFHRLGFRRIRPCHALIASDPLERKQFKETISHLLKTKSRDTVVLWLDECTIKEHPTLTSVWSQQGTRPRVNTSGGHGKVHVFGAVNPETGKVHRRLSSNLKAVAFRKFLRQLLSRYVTKNLVVIVDNARAHRPRLIHSFVEKGKGRLRVLYLPTYSPDLNPIERLWKWLRQVVTHNFLFDSLDTLKRALQKFFAHVSRNPHLVKKTCSVKL